MWKKLSALSGVLAAILFICGCGDAGIAEKRLADELKILAAGYVDNEFAKQIKLNDQCKAFLIEKNKLLLLGYDGLEVTQRPLSYDDLHEFSIARYYAGLELEIVCREAVWSNLAALDHERFTYRTLVSFKFSDTRRVWQHTPGLNIVLTAFKNKYTPDQLKVELLEKASNFFPDKKFDYYQVYSRNVPVTKRDFTVSFFVCYDPSLPGWVPEDEVLARKIKVNAESAEWLKFSADKLQLPACLKLYKDDLYWSNSHIIRQNYDKGMVFRFEQWMQKSQAEKKRRLNELMNEFDPDTASVEQMMVFLKNIKVFSDEFDLTHAYNRSVSCAKNHIRRMSVRNNSADLEVLYQQLKNEPDCEKVFSGVQDHILQEITAIKQRINRNLANQASAIKNSLRAIKELNNCRELFPSQINIICSRQENLLKKLCPQDEKIIQQILFQIRFLLLLRTLNIEEVNKLYLLGENKPLLAELEKIVLKDCPVCRKGRQKCIYCRKTPGRCSECTGKADIDSEKCKHCYNSRICPQCRGKQLMTCMNCSGRSFVILHRKADEYCRQLLIQLENILERNAAECEKRKHQL